MFIVPLVGVFSLAYWGMGSQRLAALLRSHLGAAKLGMALLFTCLGMLVLATA